MQASVATLPPPDQWGENVLSYLKCMDPDQHRRLVLDGRLRVLELFPESIKHGEAHPAYTQLMSVSELNSVASSVHRCK